MKHFFPIVAVFLLFISSEVVAFAQGWESVFLSGDIRDIDFSSPTNGSLILGDGSVFKTHNGGISWIKDPIITKKLDDIFWMNGKRGYAIEPAEDEDRVLLTDNSGKSWRDITPKDFPPGESVMKKDKSNRRFTRIFFKGQFGWLVAENGATFTTLNGGKRWEWFFHSSAVEAHFFWNKRRGIVVGDDGMILNPADFWKPVPSGITEEDLYDIVCQDRKICMAVGENGVIIETTDGGKTWHREESGVTHTLRSIEIVKEKDNYIWWVAGDGTTLLRKTVAKRERINE